MTVALVWFKKDLRCRDNPALVAACNAYDTVIPLYIRDEQILFLGEAQKWWLHHSLLALEKSLEAYGLNLFLRRGDSLTQLTELIKTYQVEAVYWNHCYEPVVMKYEREIKKKLEKLNVVVRCSNGSLLHEPELLKNKTGSYFKIFTPFWKACLKQIIVPEEVAIQRKIKSPEAKNESLKKWNLLPSKPNWAIGFEELWQPGEKGALKKLEVFIHKHLKTYKDLRDNPAQSATSKLSPHLHFGEMSPLQIWRALEKANIDKKNHLASVNTFLSEIGWREFSYYLIYHFEGMPHRNFKKAFDAFPWKKNKSALVRWQKGMTGYPIVDAGMRELWHTGYMHNRVRMIVASFLTKDLFIDWREGAAWFLDTLLDADLGSNSLNWQWVAGSGPDASPYFRIFNPVLQGEKFDPKGDYVRRWVSELAHIPGKEVHQPWRLSQEKRGAYPSPIVEHDKARKQALAYYQRIKKLS